MALSFYANGGARRAAAAIVCAAAAFASVASGDVAQSAAAAETIGGGLLADVFRVDEGPDANRTYRYATLKELVNCASSGGSFVLLRTTSWQPDYSACLPALTRLREDAESLRRGEGDDALREVAAAVAGVPDGAASVTRKLFKLAPVKEVVLTANAASGSGRAVLWRRGGDDAVQAPEAVDWNTTLAAAILVRRRVTTDGVASVHASSEWSEPLYDCAAGEWFAMLIVQQSQRTAQAETVTAPAGDGVVIDGSFRRRDDWTRAVAKWRGEEVVSWREVGKRTAGRRVVVALLPPANEAAMAKRADGESGQNGYQPRSGSGTCESFTLARPTLRKAYACDRS